MYRVVLWLARPLVKLRLKRRAQREPAYGERIAERFGEVPAGIPQRPLWVHTVSAGETIAAVNMIERLLACQSAPVLVTTMTPTGSDQVLQRLGDKVAHCYAPYDFVSAVRRFFDRVEPRMLILMETELWPTILREARRRDVPVLLVNGRLSERSAKGYARIAGLSRPMLESLTAVACQTPAHRDRFIALGAAARNVHVTGSVKFDVRLPKFYREECEQLAQMLGMTPGTPVWIAASTHPGEDEVVLDAFALARQSVPDLRLLLVPRHPVRGEALREMAQARGYSVVAQSACPMPAGTPMPDVWLGDVMGSLLQLYGLARVAFVGGSLVDVGGHNPIEPALCEVPVVCGPHRFNFTDIFEDLARAGAVVEATDAPSLAAQVVRWLEDADAHAVAVAGGMRIVEANRGATQRVIDLVSGYLPTQPQSADPAANDCAASDCAATDCSD